MPVWATAPPVSRGNAGAPASILRRSDAAGGVSAGGRERVRKRVTIGGVRDGEGLSGGGVGSVTDEDEDEGKS